MLEVECRAEEPALPVGVGVGAIVQQLVLEVLALEATAFQV